MFYQHYDHQTKEGASGWFLFQPPHQYCNFVIALLFQFRVLRFAATCICAFDCRLFSDDPGALHFSMDALLFLDQIKPIEQLVPVS